MNRFKFIAAGLVSTVIFFLPLDARAVELESRYATIAYSDYRDLRDFNDSLYMGRLKSGMTGSRDTIEDEVISKINFIVEKVMVVLDMFPPQLKFSIVIHPGEKQVQQDFKRLYKIDVDYIAFYSPSQNKVFYSADNATLRVVSHEIGHVVAENYFTISPPQKIHEVMAQFAEQHITD
ncbi:MAG: hypothetical protein KKE44_15880 [Proteobacteria bacterium]|nr:hypothetical protein [Pseudomonadota bacterium]MBU1584209.1 hypothetical protein [Pseudomonadota bacterium]MBU2628748.1 hypothetical protein [Pseudomonadota bacterium]